MKKKTTLVESTVFVHLVRKIIVLMICVFMCVGCSGKKAAAEQASEGSSDTGFCVIGFEPNGILPDEVKNPSIYIQFSKPVMPLSRLGEPSDTSDVFSIDPPLKGVFRWYGTSLLSFESSEAVIPQMEYKISVNKKLVSQSGEELTGNTEFSFMTEPLKMISIVPGYGLQQEGSILDPENVPLNAAADIAVFFSYPVNEKVTGSYLSVQDTAGKEYKSSATAIKDNPNALRLKVTDTLPLNAEISVVLKSGARSEKNYLGTSEKQTKAFHTLLPLSIETVQTDIHSYNIYDKPVRIYYSQLLAESADAFLAKNIKTEPVMSISEKNVEVSGRRVIIHGLPVDYEQKYTMTLPAGVEDKYGQKVAEPYVLKVEVPMARSMAMFKNYGNGILEAQFSPKLAFQYQNILPGSWYGVNKDRVNFDKSNVPKNQCLTQVVDLRPYLKESNGRFFGHAQFNAKMKIQEQYDGKTEVYDQNNSQIVQVSNLGATVRYGYNKAVVFVTALDTGKPVTDANVEILCTASKSTFQETLLKVLESNTNAKKLIGLGTGAVSSLGTAKTNSSGLAVIPIAPGKYRSLFMNSDNELFIEVKKDDDRLVFSPDITSMWRYSVLSVENPVSAENERQLTFMFTDRGLYKPGEKVTFRGIDRTLKLGKLSIYSGDYTIKIVKDVWKGETLYTLTGKNTESGGFWDDWAIPEDLEPGSYRIDYKRSDGSEYAKSVCFTVAYFERLRFSAAASIANVTYYRGDRIDASVSAEYLGGGSLAGNTYQASWFSEPVGFSIEDKKFNDYCFGPVQGYDYNKYIGKTEGVLNADGTGSTSIQSGSEQLKGMAYQYRTEIRVQDSGNQEVSTSAFTTVHPALYYIGLSKPRNMKGFPVKGNKIDFDYLLTLSSGEEPAQSVFPQNKKDRMITVELLREEWKVVQQMGINGTVNTRYVREMVCDHTEKISFVQKGNFSVTPAKGGSYVVRLSTIDKKGNDVVTERRMYVTGSDWYNYGNENEDLTLMCDKNLYAPGETAQIMLQSPLEKGRYLMTIERESVISEEVIEINEPVTVLNVPVKQEYLPVVYIALSSYSVRTGNPAPDFDTPDLCKPKAYFGVTPIHVKTDSMEFSVTAKPDKSSYRPGEEAMFTLTASKDGMPISGAELTFMAVDRGVIDLIDYHVQNPVAYFYDEYLYSLCVAGGDSRSLLIDPVQYAAKNLFGGDALDESDEEKMNERKKFDPTAVFEPCLITDATGSVKCTFTWPDNLTAYRITVVGVNNDRFALNESEVNVTNPVSVRDVLPRRLRVGDVSEAGVVISNLQDTAQKVTISLELFDGIEKTGKSTEDDGIIKEKGHAVSVGKTEQTITVPANMTMPLMFPIKAENQGFVSIQFTVHSNVINERIIKPLEIDKPYIFETVTTVGQTAQSDENKQTLTETLLIPGGAEDGKGSLSIMLDPSRLGVLKEAVQYVFHYPYGCLEQRSSAILPLVYFGDYIKLFGLNSEVSKPQKVIEKELAYWGSCQKDSGGFPYWPTSSYESFPVSLRIAEILIAAKESGIKIPSSIDMDRLGNYIAGRLKQYAAKSKPENIPYLFAYGNYVLQRMGHAVSEKDIKLIVESDAFDITEKCYAGLMYMGRGEKSKAKNVISIISRYMRPTTRGVDITTMKGFWSSWYYFSGETETYAIALKLFTLVDTSDQMNGRILYQLLEKQKAGNGYWNSTATTARVFDALNTYIKQNKLEDTDFSAEALLDGKKFVSGSFKGAAAEPVEKTCTFTEEPIASIPKDSEVKLEMTKNGTGTLFYTVSMKYALTAAQQTARDEGICLFTTITDLETGETVTADKLSAGKVYRLRAFVSSNRDRTFVAMRLPIPSGAEVLNAAFVTTGTYGEYKETEADYLPQYGLSNQTIYDNEVQYFWDMFPKGRQQVDFLFRAVRTGTYQTPSVTAECMYESEIFGRTAGKVWTID